MITARTKLLVMLAGASLAATASAQDLMVFPNNDQDKEQQQMDEHTCYNWAKGETSFDPMAVPTASTPPPQQAAPTGGVRRGAVRGAALGAVAGGNSDDVWKAAAVGATVGGMRRQDQKRNQTHHAVNYHRGDRRGPATRIACHVIRLHHIAAHRPRHGHVEEGPQPEELVDPP